MQRRVVAILACLGGAAILNFLIVVIQSFTVGIPAPSIFAGGITFVDKSANMSWKAVKLCGTELIAFDVETVTDKMVRRRRSYGRGGAPQDNLRRPFERKAAPPWSLHYVQHLRRSSREFGIVISLGWPVRHTCGMIDENGTPLSAGYVGRLAGRHVFVPAHIRWTEAILNWILLSVAVGVAIFGARCSLMCLRVRTGRCRACGYQLQSLRLCPECGTTSDARQR